MKVNTTLRIAASIIVLSSAAAAQALIPPGQMQDARAAFESAARARHLRCDFHPVRPALNYGLRFQTGYLVDIPLTQFVGSGHSLNTLLRVTPDGRDPVYFGVEGTVPDVPASPAAGRADAELPGTVIVGEGSYSVEALVKDEATRVCSSQWRIQVKPAANELAIKDPAPPGSVLEIGSPGPPNAPATSEIERLTILVHAAGVTPSSAKLSPEAIGTLADSISSILVQMPAKSVRLAVFNIDKQALLLSRESFSGNDLEDVTHAMEQLELAVVDYKTLQNREKLDVLSDLVFKEIHSPKPASAVIVMGPRAFSAMDSSLDSDLPRTPAARWYYLQYETAQRSARPQSWANDAPWAPQMGRGGPWDGVAPPGPIGKVPAPDGIDRLVHRLGGTTFAVRSPHDFADAVLRMAGEIPTTQIPRESRISAPKPPAAGPLPVPAGAAETPELKDPTGDEDPVEVLTHLRDRVLEHARGIPNHTCIETVQRDRYEPVAGRSTKSCDNILAARKQSFNRLRLDLTDWLRLDVGLAQNGEMFSWAGAAKFEEGEIDELITDGAFGTGPFAALLLSVFENRNPHFVFDGETNLDVRRVLEYSFRVPLEESHYRIKAHKQWIVTGYTGILFVDPKTSDLARFIVRTDELPDSTETCEVDTTLDSSMVPLAGFEYLLPSRTQQRFIGMDGSEGVNDLSFASCREFLGQSTLTFGKKPEGAEFFMNTPGANTLPAGLPLTIELASPVSFGKSAAGDRIQGYLVAPLLDPGTQRLIAPEGSKVKGRLTRVELRHAGGGEYTLAFRWEILQAGDQDILLNLKPNRRLPDLKSAARGALRQRGMAIDLPHPGEERDAVYRFSGRTVGVQGGLRGEWETVNR